MHLRICSLSRVFWVGNIYRQIENKRSALLRACVWIGSTNETCFSFSIILTRLPVNHGTFVLASLQCVYFLVRRLHERADSRLTLGILGCQRRQIQRANVMELSRSTPASPYSTRQPCPALLHSEPILESSMTYQTNFHMRPDLVPTQVSAHVGNIYTTILAAVEKDCKVGRDCGHRETPVIAYLCRG